MYAQIQSIYPSLTMNMIILCAVVHVDIFHEKMESINFVTVVNYIWQMIKGTDKSSRLYDPSAFSLNNEPNYI